MLVEVCKIIQIFFDIRTFNCDYSENHTDLIFVFLFAIYDNVNRKCVVKSLSLDITMEADALPDQFNETRNRIVMFCAVSVVNP